MLRKKTQKGLLRLIGTELHLMTSSNVIELFVISSICLIVVILLTFLSIEFAFEYIFENVFIDFFLSSFISYLFGNIYIFLIHTLSKDTISKNEKKSFFSLSNISRLGFIIFIAFIISKPIEVYLLQNKVQPKIEAYKSNVIKNSNQLYYKIYDDKLKKIDHDIFKLQVENKARMDFQSDKLKDLYVTRNKYLSELNELINKTNEEINSSNFFITKIKITSSSFFISWIICLVIITIFLLPVYFLFRINTNHDYYLKKSNYERNIIDNDYESFKIKYSEIFQKKYNLNITFYETYSDHPYKTTKMTNTSKDQSNFIQKYFIS